MIICKTEGLHPKLRIGPPKRSLFEQGSSVERSRAWLTLLFDEGRRATRLFLDRHGADIGTRETLDVASLFTHARKPKLRTAAAEAIGEANGAEATAAALAP